MNIEKIILLIGEGHGVHLSYHPMGRWACRITTFEHGCGPASDHETWCNGQCSVVMGRKTAESAIRDSAVKANINMDMIEQQESDHE